MIRVRVDGQWVEIGEGAPVGEVLPRTRPGHTFAVIRSGPASEVATPTLLFRTSAGEITVEISAPIAIPLLAPDFPPCLSLQWQDRYCAAFGPFPSTISPSRRPARYDRGAIILGCGGYDPGRSFLVFSKRTHSADHGAGADGGVIGTVTSGRGVLDRWVPGDRILSIEPVIRRADTSRSFTTTDRTLLLEEDMQIVSRIDVLATGYAPGNVETGASRSVEHLLNAMRGGVFHVGRQGSTYLADDRLAGTDIPEEIRKPRREGSVTIQTRGGGRGTVYIYTADVPSSPGHCMVGQVTHGIELARLAREGDLIDVAVTPAKFDLIGLPLAGAIGHAQERGIGLSIDSQEGERVVVGQDPGTTLEVLAEGSAAVQTAPVPKVIDLVLDDLQAPESCRTFRNLTGLASHDVGALPFFFTFDDVFLFKPKIPRGTRINPENTPSGPVAGGTLAITNDARKGAGLVGVRISEHSEFGPTSEPFEGTNVIGRVIDLDKLRGISEKEMVYIREVRQP